jgi:hypothetical protein
MSGVDKRTVLSEDRLHVVDEHGSRDPWDAWWRAERRVLSHHFTRLRELHSPGCPFGCERRSEKPEVDGSTPSLTTIEIVQN